MSDNDLGTRKTFFVLVIIVGCFAVLWPKVFYPMLVGPTQNSKPNTYEKGCCDVISDIDINTIKIMSELCLNIVESKDLKDYKEINIISHCRAKVLEKCGIDLSSVLQEQVRLGRSFKQIVDEVRSFNGSLCLKYNFGLSPWRLGVPHKVTLKYSPINVKQERPSHLSPEMLHPALREKGRAIPHPYEAPIRSSQAKFVNGRPGPVPGVRPPMGGAGHIVPPPKGLNSMGVIMPIYTIGIVIFFSYTLMKLIFKRRPEGPAGSLYPPVEPSVSFRKEVFESQKKKMQEHNSSKLVVNAMSALLDEVDQELEARRRAREVANQKENASNGVLVSNGDVKKNQEHEQPSVKVLGMEMRASCEGGQKWNRPDSPLIPTAPPPAPVEPPQEIFLEGALPAHSQLLVSDATTEKVTQDSSSVDPSVVIASKMTLSVISLDAQKDNELNNDLEDFEDSKYITASGATVEENVSDVADDSEIEENYTEEEEEEIEEEEEVGQVSNVNIPENQSSKTGLTQEANGNLSSYPDESEDVLNRNREE